MRRIRPSSEEEMIATWVLAELTSGRFAERTREILDRLQIDERVIIQPDLEDPKGNAQRRAVLQQAHGYDTDEGNFLSAFPDRVNWERVSLTPDELLSALYINWDYWLKLSGGSRSPRDGANAVREGRVIYNVPNDYFLAIAEAVRDSRTLPPLIMITTGETGDPLCVIEGHARLTGYALAERDLRVDPEVLLGTSTGFKDWWAY